MLEVDVRGQIGVVTVDTALKVDRAECLAIAGPSGAGKTTLLRMIAGLVRPDEGRIALGERVLFDGGKGIDLEPEERRCGFVFQEYALFPHMTAWQNVAFGLGRRSRGDKRSKATELLDRFGVGSLADSRPSQLSGGERQRVALARAIASDPQMLLLDEPLAALDVRTRAQAAREIAETVRALEVPALLVTHDFTDAALIGQRVAALVDGRITQQGTPTELAAQPTSPFVADLTGANVLHGNARGRDDGLTEIVLDGGGSLVSTDAAAGEVAVSVQPWDITIHAAEGESGSARNALAAEVTSITPTGNRVRVGLKLPDAAVAEVTQSAVDELGLRPGLRVVASFKASSTRLLAVDKPG